jgi:GT2 family glycosyltransferase
MKARAIVENVKSLKQQVCDFKFKIFVVDNSVYEENANILRELEGLEDVSVTINKENTGYPKAHNKFNDKLEGEYILIVNPDIEWREDDAVCKMIEYMDKHPEIGVLGPRQIEKNGNTAMSIRAFPKLYLQVARRTWLRKLPILKSKVAFDEMRHLDYTKTQEVDWLQSSCVVVRRDLWEQISGLNEDYFLFMSDVELCLDAWKAGKKVVYYPEVKVYADGKRVSAGGFKTFFKSWVLRKHTADSIKYRMKHFFEENPRLKV